MSDLYFQALISYFYIEIGHKRREIMIYDKRDLQLIAHNPNDSSDPKEIERFLKDLRWRLRIIKPRKYIEIKTFLYACDKIRPVGYGSVGDKHDFWEFTLVVKGCALELSDDKEHLLTEGMMVAHKPMEFHKTYQQGDAELEFMVASFELVGEDVDFFADKIFNLLPSQISLFKTAVQALSKYYSGYGSEKNLQKGISIFEGLLCDLVISAETDREKRIDPRYLEIVGVLNRNYEKKLTLSELSQKCNMSVSLMKKIFAQNSDCGIMAYFSKIKIRRATELLDQGYDAEETARMLSYSSYEYFIYCFKRETGMTPLKYLKKEN